MTKLDYFKYAIQNKHLTKFNWYTTVLGLPVNNQLDNEYLVIRDNMYYVKINNTEVKLEHDISEPIFTPNTELILTNEDIPNISGTITTTFGKAIVNYLLLYRNFNTKIPYMNGEISIGKVEDAILKLYTKDIILTSEYIAYISATSFLANLDSLVSVSATPKNILSAPGIDNYKKQVRIDMDKKYGKEWIKDKTRVKEYEDLLTTYDDEYLKDDPSKGKLMSGKVKDVARNKMHLMYGSESGFDRSGTSEAIISSLREGWSKEPKQLASMFNAARAGSYLRGFETQKGGVTAKVVLRATNSIKIHPEHDCGTKRGKKILVTEDNVKYMVGRYIMENGKQTALTEETVNSYIGKTITIRSVQYCIMDNNNICGVCCGQQLAGYENGISILMTDISGAILYISMAATHGQKLQTMKYDIRDNIK